MENSSRHMLIISEHRFRLFEQIKLTGRLALKYPSAFLIVPFLCSALHIIVPYEFLQVLSQFKALELLAVACFLNQSLVLMAELFNSDSFVKNGELQLSSKLMTVFLDARKESEKKDDDGFNKNEWLLSPEIMDDLGWSKSLVIFIPYAAFVGLPFLMLPLMPSLLEEHSVTPLLLKLLSALVIVPIGVILIVYLIGPFFLMSAVLLAEDLSILESIKRCNSMVQGIRLYVSKNLCLPAFLWHYISIFMLVFSIIFISIFERFSFLFQMFFCFLGTLTITQFTVSSTLTYLTLRDEEARLKKSITQR